MYILAYSAVSRLHRLARIFVWIRTLFLEWLGITLRPYRRTWQRPLQGTGHEIFEWTPFLWGYPDGSMVKDTKLLGIHNLFPCLLLLFQLTVGQVLVCESTIFRHFNFFTASLLLQNSALNAAFNSASIPARFSSPCCLFTCSFFHWAILYNTAASSQLQFR